MDKWQKERKDGTAVDCARVCCAVEDHIGNNKFDYENSNVHKSNKRISSSNNVCPAHLTNKDTPKDMRGIRSIEGAKVWWRYEDWSFPFNKPTTNI